MTSTHDPGDNFGIGDTIVQYAAVDAAGNTAMCTFTVTVVGKEGSCLVWTIVTFFFQKREHKMNVP